MWTTRRTSAVAAVLAALAGSTACGGSPDELRSLDDRLARVATAWEAPALGATWDRSVVIERVSLAVLVAEAPLTPAERALLLDGAVVVPEPVAAQADRVEDAEVTYADGGPPQRVPTQGVAESLAGLVLDDPPSCGSFGRCEPLVVGAVAPDTVSVPTARGPALLPAWRVTFDGVTTSIVVPSVADVLTPDQVVAAAGTVTGLPEQGSSGVQLEAREGRRLTLLVSVGACSGPSTTRVVQRPDVVVVGYVATRSGGGDDCATVQLPRRVEVTLDAPVGSRPVVDERGRPVLVAAPLQLAGP